jgi:hypothetical protein
MFFVKNTAPAGRTQARVPPELLALREVRMPRLLPALCFCALVLPSPCPAAPFIEHLAPPVLQSGKTTRLTVVGSHLAKAADLWTSLPGGKLQTRPVGASKDGSAVFDVRVPASAPIGLFGLRVATAGGLSNVHLCLIDDLPVSPAPESSKEVPKVDLPCALWGRFREGEVDRFRIDVKAGQEVSFEVVGNRFGKEVDPLLTIRDARGKFVAERDNDPGLYFDCRFSHRFAAAGTYVVEVRDSRFQGHDHGYWVLRMGRFPAARVAVPASVRSGTRANLLLPELSETLSIDLPAALPPGPLSLPLRRPADEGSTWLPVEVGDLGSIIAAADATTLRKGMPVKVPAQLCGVLRSPREPQFFRLELAKRQTIHVTGHGRCLNSSIDLDLDLTDEQGRVLRRAAEGPDDTVRLDFTAPAAGFYGLAVRDQARAGGPACAYRIALRDTPPEPVVVAEVEGLTVPCGSYQPVPLRVTRNGHGGPIALTLSGAPEGVVLTPAEVPAGVDSLVCKLSAGASSPPGLHTLRLWAQATKHPSSSRVPVRVRPLVDRQLHNVDLIPYSLREDQLRLPPSLCDRLALQVTEAAPFTVELAEPVVTLPRYQHAPIPLLTTRKPGFDAPISFTARGGQLADKKEGRTRVYAEFPEATTKTLKVAGSIHSRILSNVGRTRIEVLATAKCASRSITLIRTFDLEIHTAFTIATDSTPVKLAAGSAARVRLKVDRVKTFAGAVAVSLSPADGLEFPETVTIPPNRDSVEVEVKVQPGTAPGRRSVYLSATADVDGFEEEHRGARIDVEVPRPEAPKKK